MLPGRLIILAFLTMTCANVSSQTCQDLAGQWQNALGSVLDIEAITKDNKINGVYRSSTGVDGKVFSILGWVNQQSESDSVVSVAVTVRWEGYGSITSWTGYCDTDDEGPYMKLLWHLVRPDTAHAWERIITNSSTFRPLEQ